MLFQKGEMRRCLGNRRISLPSSNPMNRRDFAIVLFLVFWPVISFAQSSAGSATVLTADELCSRLLQAKDRTAALALLKENKASITRFLWMRLISEAVKDSNAGKHARALIELELAKGAAEYLGDKKLLGHTYYRMGYLRFAQGDIKGAMASYLLSKEIFEDAKATGDLVYVLSELGNLFTFTKDYKNAEEYSEKSLALADSSKPAEPSISGLPGDYGIAHAWSNLGEVSLWKGDYNESLVRFQKALGLWEKLNREGVVYRAHIINALTDIGIAYRMMGLHAESLKYWYRALELAKTAEDKARIAAALVSIGLLYLEQRDYSQAADFLNQSLRLFTEANNQREIANALLNIGLLKQRLKDYVGAIETFEKALSIAERISAPDLVVAAQEGLGVVYYEQRRYETASQCFETAWSLAEKTGDRIRMTELLWRKGQVFYAKEAYVQASASAKDAANLATRLRSPLMTYLTLTLLGKAQRAQGEHGAAVESFMRAIDAVEQMRDQIAGGEKEQQLFFEDKLSPYHEIVSELAKANRAEALNYAERAKGRVLLDVLRNGRISTNKFLNQSEQTEERRLYSEMVSLNTQIRVERMRQQPDDSRIEEMESRLRKARNAYEAFQAALFAAHPELEIKRGQFSTFTLQDARALLPDARTAILEYVVTDEQTFLFVLTRSSTGQAKAVEVEVDSIKITRAELAGLVEKYRGLLSTNHPGFYHAGRELYDLLVRPAEPCLRGKTTVCVVPDGPLWNLPFQALQTAGDKYLLELFAMYYAPSLQVLREMRKKSDNLQTLPVSKREANEPLSLSPLRQTGQLYAIGNPAFGGEALARVLTLRNTPFVPLPETEREVQTLATAVYGPQASAVRIGAAAREDAVKAEMGKYRVLHFATHGVLDNENPLYSYIILAPSIDSKEDGLLEAWELMEMDLKAELAVLSACDTARGRIGDGEGMIGMTWALFVAGVPTTVASQWQVPSESTTNLMLGFHRNVVGGSGERKMSKAEAWRQAVLVMINNPRYRMKPYYWAGFVVVGDGGR
jgi:CHAT domain-containing protein/tetratricopeptide (TPR) repeat protein